MDPLTLRTYAVRGLHARLTELNAERARILELLSVWDSDSKAGAPAPSAFAKAMADTPQPESAVTRRRRASGVATNADVVTRPTVPDAAPVTVEREEARVLPRRRARVQVQAEPQAPVLPPMPRLVKANAS